MICGVTRFLPILVFVCGYLLEQADTQEDVLQSEEYNADVDWTKHTGPGLYSDTHPQQRLPRDDRKSVGNGDRIVYGVENDKHTNSQKYINNAQNRREKGKRRKLFNHNKVAQERISNFYNNRIKSKKAREKPERLEKTKYKGVNDETMKNIKNYEIEKKHEVIDLEKLLINDTVGKHIKNEHTNSTLKDEVPSKLEIKQMINSINHIKNSTWAKHKNANPYTDFETNSGTNLQARESNGRNNKGGKLRKLNKNKLKLSNNIAANVEDQANNSIVKINENYKDGSVYVDSEKKENDDDNNLKNINEEWSKRNKFHNFVKLHKTHHNNKHEDDNENHANIPINDSSENKLFLTDDENIVKINNIPKKEADSSIITTKNEIEMNNSSSDDEQLMRNWDYGTEADQNEKEIEKDVEKEEDYDQSNTENEDYISSKTDNFEGTDEQVFNIDDKSSFKNSQAPSQNAMKKINEINIDENDSGHHTKKHHYQESNKKEYDREIENQHAVFDDNSEIKTENKDGSIDINFNNVSGNVNNSKSGHDIKKRYNWIGTFRSKNKNAEENFFGPNSDSDTLDESQEVEMQDDGNEDQRGIENKNGDNYGSSVILDESKQYSYKQNREENGEISEEDNIKKNFSRRSQVPKQSKDEPGNNGICTDSYKAEKMTIKPTEPTKACKTTESATQCATKSPQISSCPIGVTNGNYVSQTTKTTPKTKSKSSTKKSNTNNENNLNSNDDIDEYGQYLCGKLADDFIAAVLTKVKRSRKIVSELGFKNDTDETCDRCIETKPIKFPSLETMRSSLGKCSKYKKENAGCLTCYNVPKPMEKFLNLIVLYEKEHETCAYNKIRDDSSFIFTGDYTDQLTRNNDLAESRDESFKETDIFDKSTFEKQHFKEDNPEEKGEDQIQNSHVVHKVRSKPTENEIGEEDYATGTLENKEENNNSEIASDVSKEKPVKADQNKGKTSVLSDEKLKENDQDKDIYANPSLIKHPFYKEHDINGLDERLIETNSVRRRKAYRSDNIKIPKIARGFTNVEQIPDREVLNHQNDMQNYDFRSPQKIKNNYALRNTYDTQLSVHSGPSRYENKRQRYSKNNFYNNIKPYSNNNRKMSPWHYMSSDKYSKLNRFFNYPSDDYVEIKKDHQYENNERKFANDLNPQWDDSEYQLVSNLPGQNLHNDAMNSGLKQYYKNKENLEIVKRDAEPNYEDQLIFFEIPDGEYDLYGL